MKSDRFYKSPTLSRFVTRLSAEIDGMAPLQAASDAGFIDLTQTARPYALKSLSAPSEDEQGLLAELVALMSDSPLASALLAYLTRKDWSLGLSAQGDGHCESGYQIDLSTKTIWLDHGGLSPAALRQSVHCYHALLACLVRSLRDAGHEARLNGYETALRPDAVLMLERVRAGDVEAVLTMIAWELRSAGHPQLWRHLLGSEDGDIALSFGYTIEKNPTSLYNGQAMAAAFARWYKDDMRLNGCDHDTLEYLDGLLAAQTVPQSWGTASLCADDIRDISVLPDGYAYLKEEAADIVKSPVFQVMPDAINEAHLFQITYDAQAVTVSGVPFRSASLARKIFPAQ